MSLGTVLSQGWDTFKKDLGLLIGATFVMGVLAILSVGLLAGPLAAGLQMMIIERMRHGTEPKFGDLFKHLNRFFACLGFFVILLLGGGILGAVLGAIGLAKVASIAGFILGTPFTFGLPLIADRQLGPIDAMGESWRMVQRAGFGKILLYMIVLSLIVGVSLVIPFGGLVGAPYFICCLTYMYSQTLLRPIETSVVPAS